MDDVGSDVRVFVESVRVGWSDGLRFRGGVVTLGSEGGGVVLGSKGGEGVVCLDR